MLAATRNLGAQIGFMNEGGIRKDLEAGPDNVAAFGQTQAVLPFGNTLVVMDLSGAQIRRLLEQQWRSASSNGSMLQVSNGFSYTWDERRPVGSRVTSITLNGESLVDARTYRIVANNFLAEGGDGLLDHELIEYLLALAIPRRDTKPLARLLLSTAPASGPDPLRKDCR